MHSLCSNTCQNSLRTGLYHVPAFISSFAEWQIQTFFRSIKTKKQHDLSVKVLFDYNNCTADKNSPRLSAVFAMRERSIASTLTYIAFKTVSQNNKIGLHVDRLSKLAYFRGNFACMPNHQMFFSLTLNALLHYPVNTENYNCYRFKRHLARERWYRQTRGRLTT